MFEKVKKLITTAEIKELLPVSKESAAERALAIGHIQGILDGTTGRKLFIVGPCSADDPNAVKDYAYRLSELSFEVREKIYIVMRVYTAKPRTRGEGYMGLMFMPNSDSPATDIQSGLIAARALHTEIMRDCGLFTADELLYPEAYPYFDDVLTYATVGARSSEDQMHRFTASGADIPVGIKNPLNGNMSDLVNSIHAATISNEFMLCGNQVRTSGNRYVHAVLRGYTDGYGNDISNYGKDNVSTVIKALGGRGSVIIDTAHSNSGKDPARVADIVKTVTDGMRGDGYYANAVKGFMIESYLRDGARNVCDSGYGVSVTDPCLGFENTRKVILYAAEKLP